MLEAVAVKLKDAANNAAQSVKVQMIFFINEYLQIFELILS